MELLKGGGRKVRESAPGKELMGYCGGSVGGQGPSMLVRSVSSSPGMYVPAFQWRTRLTVIAGFRKSPRYQHHRKTFTDADFSIVDNMCLLLSWA